LCEDNRALYALAVAVKAKLDADLVEVTRNRFTRQGWLKREAASRMVVDVIENLVRLGILPK
jgi:hypothetical protein